MTAPATYAAVVLRLREAAGLSRYRLAQQSGVTAQQLMRIERGEQVPGLDAARRIAAALGQSLAVFDSARSS